MSPIIYPKMVLIAFILAYMLAVGAAAQPAPAQVTFLDPMAEGGNRTVPSNLSIDSSAFADAGCSFDDGYADCSRAGLDKRFGCSSIRNASNDLGGLSPKLPMAECLIRGKDFESGSDKGIVSIGCMITFYRRYIIEQDGRFKSISTKEEFRSQFAPVETPEEALSFAVALTDSFSKYDTSIPEGYFPVVKHIELSYVEDEKNGTYKVHLFQEEYCGCGMHPWYAIDYLVTRDGNITEIDRQMILNSTKLICMD